MTRYRWFAMALIVALAGALLAPGTMTAQDADCDGVDAYVEAINATGNPVMVPDALELPPGIIDDWSEEDLAATQAELDRIVGELEAVDPPGVAESFHQYLIATMETLSTFMQIVADEGVDAGYAYADEAASSDEQLYDEALVLEESCSVALLDHNFDGVPEIGEGAGEEAATTIEAPSASAERVPLTTSAALDDQWELTVLSFTPDATAEVLAYDPSNSPPADGMQYVIARVRISNIGTTDGNFSGWRLSLADSSGQTYAPFIDYCGFIPDELTTDTIAPGEQVEGNVCWAVPASGADASSALVIFDGDAFPDERIYFALDASAGASGEATGGGFAGAVEDASTGAIEGLGTPQADSTVDDR